MNNFPIQFNKIVSANTTILAANTNRYGIDNGNTKLLFKSQAPTGTKINGITAKALGTNVATVLRLFLSKTDLLNKIDNTNTILINETTLAATTATATAILTNNIISYSTDTTRFIIPTGWCLYVTLGTAVAAGYHIAFFGADY